MINRVRGFRAPFACVTAMLLAGAIAPEAHAQSPALGVYEYVVEKAQGNVATVAASIEQAFGAGGWEVLARFDTGSPAGCKFRAQVVAVVDRASATRAMLARRATAPFAIVDRIAVFEDEAGVHVAVVNAEVHPSNGLYGRPHAGGRHAHAPGRTARRDRGRPSRASHQHASSARSGRQDLSGRRWA